MKLPVRKLRQKKNVVTMTLEMRNSILPGLCCRLIVKWLLPRRMPWTYPLFRVHFNKANWGAKQASLLLSGASCLRREEFCPALDKRFGPPQHPGNYSFLTIYSLLSGQIQYIYFATEVVKTKAEFHFHYYNTHIEFPLSAVHQFSRVFVCVTLPIMN